MIAIFAFLKYINLIKCDLSTDEIIISYIEQIENYSEDKQTQKLEKQISIKEKSEIDKIQKMCNDGNFNKKDEGILARDMKNVKIKFNENAIVRFGNSMDCYINGKLVEMPSKLYQYINDYIAKHNTESQIVK